MLQSKNRHNKNRCITHRQATIGT